jgi:hypothetical protein
VATDEQSQPVIVPVLQAEEEAIEEEEEELDLVAQMVAEDGIVREEQHDQVMEGIAQCQSRLEALSGWIRVLEQSQSTENPMLTQIQQQLADLQRQMTEQEKQRSESTTSLPSSHSGKTKPETEEDGPGKTGEPQTRQEGENPAESVPGPPPRKKKFNKL